MASKLRKKNLLLKWFAFFCICLSLCSHGTKIDVTQKKFSKMKGYYVSHAESTQEYLGLGNIQCAGLCMNLPLCHGYSTSADRRCTIHKMIKKLTQDRTKSVTTVPVPDILADNGYTEYVPGRWFKLFSLDNDKTWQEAVTECHKPWPTGQLFVIQDDADFEILTTEGSTSDFWIGLQKDDSQNMNWVDGTDFSKFIERVSLDTKGDDALYARAKKKNGGNLEVHFKKEDEAYSQFACQVLLG